MQFLDVRKGDTANATTSKRTGKRALWFTWRSGIFATRLVLATGVKVRASVWNGSVAVRLYGSLVFRLVLRAVCGLSCWIQLLDEVPHDTSLAARWLLDSDFVSVLGVQS